MSSRDAGGTSPSHESEEEDYDDTSDTESGSSYIGSAAPDTPACPHRDSTLDEGECSRYLDCPTHTIERDTSRNEDQTTTEVVPSSPLTQDDQTTSGLSCQSRENPEATLPSTEFLGRVSSTHRNISSGSRVLSRVEALARLRALARSRDSAYYGMPSSSLMHDGQTSEVQRQARENVASLRQAQIESASSHRSSSTHADPGSSISLREALSAGRPRPSRRASERSTRSGTSATAPSAQTTTAQPPAGHMESVAPTSTSVLPARAPNDLTLPRWQPDAEVTYCPICHRQFSIFIRKHHCRKCGRVVCGACSPHRITIPHQYIVRPPDQSLYPSLQPFPGEEGGFAELSAIGGGERVRLCNPCVPDPNTTPPQSQQSASPLTPSSPHNRARGSSRSNLGVDNRHNQYHPYFPTNPQREAHTRSRSATVQPGSAYRPHGRPHPSSQNPILSGTPPSYYPSNRSNQPQGLQSVFGFGSGLNMGAPAFPPSSVATQSRPLPPAPPPPRQIPEEDECPICHRELPSRDLPNFENLRESHVSSCIAAHSTYGATAPAPASGLGRLLRGQGTPPPRTARRTGMFPYLATEKDCVDSAECTICLEEFEVGVPMARLECLCRFHRECINAWWVDHPGRCPVHQHDSFGY